MAVQVVEVAVLELRDSWQAELAAATLKVIAKGKWAIM